MQAAAVGLEHGICVQPSHTPQDVANLANHWIVQQVPLGKTKCQQCIPLCQIPAAAGGLNSLCCMHAGKLEQAAAAVHL